MDHEHTEDDPGQTIYVLKRSFRQSAAELFSVTLIPNVVHHFFRSVLLALKGEWCYEANKLNCNLSEEGYEQGSESNSCTQSVFNLETYSVRIIIIEVLLYTHFKFE